MLRPLVGHQGFEPHASLIPCLGKLEPLAALPRNHSLQEILAYEAVPVLAWGPVNIPWIAGTGYL